MQPLGFHVDLGGFLFHLSEWIVIEYPLIFKYRTSKVVISNTDIVVNHVQDVYTGPLPLKTSCF